jgi:hypothetical protein
MPISLGRRTKAALLFEVKFFQYTVSALWQTGYVMTKHHNPNLMKSVRKFVLAALCCTGAFAVSAADAPSLDKHLEPLRPFLKTWKGTFKDSKPEHPTVDVAKWERALNGRAVRLMHSINNGVYGGETMLIWDEKKQSVVYYYFTTEGYMTSGTMTVKDGKIITNEVVSGGAGGVTEVRATSELQADGGFHVKAEYLKNGEWAPGHEVTYREDPSAEVVFK